ncbi:UNVERIFIED_CONTAM: hypothetical protein Scaly_2653600 [Sesamum calycinum]|uniref:Uncharacterized protein n=1 Tax=Sesamum calycinum TaxID=2727403 RepID=A0AAW2J9W5_9LAMI
MTELGDKASCNMTQEEETLIGEDYFSNMGIPNEESMSAMTFTDEDLLLGSKPHNRLLFVTCYARYVFNHTLFHVIDAKTSYNILLSRPWLHENDVVPSTWHQYFKYSRDGVVKKVLADDKPFTKVESHFTYAKYYLGITKDKQNSSAEKSEQQISHDEGKTTTLAGGNKNDSKEKSSLVGFDSLKELVFPLTNIDARKPQPLKGFVRLTQGSKKEQEEPSKLQIAKGFDLKAYKLLVKVGYNPRKRCSRKTLSRD